MESVSAFQSCFVTSVNFTKVAKITLHNYPLADDAESLSKRLSIFLLLICVLFKRLCFNI